MYVNNNEVFYFVFANRIGVSISHELGMINMLHIGNGCSRSFSLLVRSGSDIDVRT